MSARMHRESRLGRFNALTTRAAILRLSRRKMGGPKIRVEEREVSEIRGKNGESEPAPSEKGL